MYYYLHLIITAIDADFSIFVDFIAKLAEIERLSSICICSSITSFAFTNCTVSSSYTRFRIPQ